VDDEVKDTQGPGSGDVYISCEIYNKYTEVPYKNGKMAKVEDWIKFVIVLLSLLRDLSKKNQIKNTINNSILIIAKILNKYRGD
jgi:hypothetical protein